MKKRLISMLLTVLMVASLFSGMSVSAYAGGDGEEVSDTIQYTMVAGDTVLKICNNLGINFKVCEPAILKLNNISNYSKMSVGTVLTMPTSDAAAARIMSSNTTIGSNNGGVVVNNSNNGAANNTAVNANIAYWLIPYTIQRGETVAGVCSALGISFDTYKELIMQVNGISSWNRVKAGSTLLLPSATRPVVGTSCYQVIAHKISSGETAYGICQKYGVSYNSASDLMAKLNPGTKLTNIKYGKTLLVPVSAVITSGYTSGTVTNGTVSGGTTSGGTTTGGTVSGGTTTGGTTSGSVSTAKTYKLSTGTISGGSVSFKAGGKTVTSAAAGTTVQIVATPESYKGLETINLVYADGSAVPPITNSTFTMPACDVRVDAKFVGGYYMTRIADHGSIALYVNDVATETASKGAKVRVEVTPDTGYEISKIYVQKSGSKDLVVSSMKNGGTFTMPDHRVFVVAEFNAVKTYGFTKVNDLYSGFELKVNGGVVLSAAAGATVEVVPNLEEGREVDEIIVVDAKGKRLTVKDNNTFTMPASEVTVTLTTKAAAQPYYNLFLDTVNFGSIEAWGERGGNWVAVDAAYAGETVRVTARKDVGYWLEKMVVKSNGNSVTHTSFLNNSAFSKYDYIEFTMPKGDVYVTPTFKAKTATYDGMLTNDSSIGTIVISANGAELKSGDKVKVGDAVTVNVAMTKTGYAVDKINVGYIDYAGNPQHLDGATAFNVPAGTNFSVEVLYKALDNKLSIKSDWVGGYRVIYNSGTVDSGVVDTVLKDLQVKTATKVEILSEIPGKTVEIEVFGGIEQKDLFAAGNGFNMPGCDVAIKVHLK